MGSITTNARSRSQRGGRGGFRRQRLGIAVLLALGLTACSGGDDDSAASGEPASEDSAAAEAMDAPADTVAGNVDDSRFATTATAEATTTAAPIDLNFGRDLVIDAGLVIVTSDIRSAVDDIMRIARQNGGAIFNTDVVIDDPRDDGSVPGGGSIVVRLPPAQLDLLIGDLGGVGTIRNQTQTVDDVTDRVTDLEVQIEQARISVDRMQALLAEATDFDGLVAAERELVNRQTTYERLLAAQRNLDDRVSLSTLTILLEYAAPAEIDQIVETDEPGIADAFSDGWNAFVGVLFGAAFILAVAAPFLAVLLFVAALGLWIARRLGRRRDAVRNRHEPLEPSRTTTQFVDDESATTVEAGATSGPD